MKSEAIKRINASWSGVGRSVILQVGDAEVLFSLGRPVAFFSGGDVYFPDLLPARTGNVEANGGQCISPSDTRKINQFHPEAAHIRVSAAEYDFVVASTIMRAVRPLTRGPR